MKFLSYLSTAVLGLIILSSCNKTLVITSGPIKSTVTTAKYDSSGKILDQKTTETTQYQKIVTVSYNMKPDMLRAIEEYEEGAVINKGFQTIIDGTYKGGDPAIITTAQYTKDMTRESKGKRIHINLSSRDGNLGAQAFRMPTETKNDKKNPAPNIPGFEYEKGAYFWHEYDPGHKKRLSESDAEFIRSNPGSKFTTGLRKILSNLYN